MLESVRARLALWHAATLGVLLIGFALVAYVYTERSTLHRTDEYLRASAGAFVGVLRAEREEMGEIPAAARAAVKDFRFGDLHVTVFDAALRPLASSPAVAPAPRRTGPDSAAAPGG
ncbi:MAG TPA: hypothetical protein VGO40_06725, partial [Longimicrobium sp.]|nr:hypothetical protein [Longimicrobium sp.]